MQIWFAKTALGIEAEKQLGISILPSKTNMFDAGFDVRAAISIVIEPYTKKFIPLGWVYRIPHEPFQIDSRWYTYALQVAKKGSGIAGLEEQAVYFDLGYLVPLDNDEGVSLILTNLTPNRITIEAGRKIMQLVPVLVPYAEGFEKRLEELAAVPQLDGRGAGRAGSTGS